MLGQQLVGIVCRVCRATGIVKLHQLDASSAYAAARSLHQSRCGSVGKVLSEIGEARQVQRLRDHQCRGRECSLRWLRWRWPPAQQRRFAATGLASSVSSFIGVSKVCAANRKKSPRDYRKHVAGRL